MEIEKSRLKDTGKRGNENKRWNNVLHEIQLNRPRLKRGKQKSQNIEAKCGKRQKS